MKNYEKVNDPKGSIEKIEKRLFESNEFDITDVSKTNPKEHVLSTHETKKSFDCNHCEYSTSVKRNLKIHISVHHTEPIFNCNQCEYSTGKKQYLQRHSMVHNTEQTFNCKQCDYSTLNKGNLTMHYSRNEKL